MSAVETEAETNRGGPDLSFLERAVVRTPDIPGSGPNHGNRGQNHASSGSGNVLNVGKGITVSGEIGDCDTLVVEGTVTATLSDGRALEISPGGIFKGTARVDEARIAGRFDGDLTVSGQLHIAADGHVTGRITYGRLEIVSGGELNGNVSISASAD